MMFKKLLSGAVLSSVFLVAVAVHAQRPRYFSSSRKTVQPSQARCIWSSAWKAWGSRRPAIRIRRKATTMC